MSSIRTKKHQAVSYYHRAKSAVVAAGFNSEIQWQDSVRVDSMTECDFLRECSWVILNSGFREAVARKKFDHLSLAFGDWESAEFISRNREMCVRVAMDGFKHYRKLCAIADVADLVYHRGFLEVERKIRATPIEFLMELPYIGPITVWHLAKNLGFDVAKPDRHLLQIASAFGYSCVQELCGDISRSTGDRLAVVDLIFWRYAADFASPKAMV